MYQKKKSSWLKHLDFIVLDCLCMELAFVIAYLLRHGWGNIYTFALYRDVAGILVLMHLLVVFFGEGYKGIVRRGYFEELKAAVIHVTAVDVLLNMYLYLLKKSGDYSRITYVLMWGISIIFIYAVRVLWKNHIRSKQKWGTGQRSLIIVSLEESAGKAVKIIRENSFGDYTIAGIVLLDAEIGEKDRQIQNITVVADGSSVVEYVRYHWVDEVFFDIPFGTYDCEKLIGDCEEMGITVHQRLAVESEMYRHNQIVERMGGYTVLTSSVNMVSNRQLFFKRTLDIIGALFGLLCTGILFIFVAPCIFVKSPGPVFFSQWRVRKNGKKFRIYKFRSMYMDAEKRKQELMKDNNIKSGLMFKIDRDPRVIKGIGEFIRKTSIDEFPQFFNVLRGEMSLVGTRPPTVDEWTKYELYHRKRMAIKPGLTGMWQVSGRSEITDFDEVVALDTKYIKEWSFGLDLRILAKTVLVVLKRKGAS